MSAEIVGTSGGVLSIEISGRLTHSEFDAIQKSAAEILRQEGSMRVLVFANRFEGWEREGRWDNSSFKMNNDGRIEKMAIVGEKKWEELAVVFTGKGFRPFPIEYFEFSELALARAWLAAKR